MTGTRFIDTYYPLILSLKTAEVQLFLALLAVKACHASHITALRATSCRTTGAKHLIVAAEDHSWHSMAAFGHDGSEFGNTSMWQTHIESFFFEFRMCFLNAFNASQRPQRVKYGKIGFVIG